MKTIDCSCGEVRYEIFEVDKRPACVFSAMQLKDPSIATAAAEVIRKIEQEEGLDVEDVDFFELATFHGLPNLEPPKFEFRAVIVTVEHYRRSSGRIFKIEWKTTPCGQHVISKFKTLIVGSVKEEPHQLMPKKPSRRKWVTFKAG